MDRPAPPGQPVKGKPKPSPSEGPPAATGTLHSATHPTPVSLLTILKSIARQSGQHRFYLPAPWQLVMVALKTVEMLGIHSPFPSDSLTGLVHGNPLPANPTPPAGVRYRPFA